jgi:hypothetical protein
MIERYALVSGRIRQELADMERLLHYIAAQVDRSVPEGTEWHRDLLRQRRPIYWLLPTLWIAWPLRMRKTDGQPY